MRTIGTNIVPELMLYEMQSYGFSTTRSQSEEFLVPIMWIFQNERNLDIGLRSYCPETGDDHYDKSSVFTFREQRRYLSRSSFINDSSHASDDEVPNSSESAPTVTNFSGKMECLYLKIESGGQVQRRLQYVRPDFKALVDQSCSQWMDRLLLKNHLLDS